MWQGSRVTTSLLCSFWSGLKRTLAKPGRSCHAGDMEYVTGDMFYPNCQSECFCVDGNIGCRPPIKNPEGCNELNLLAQPAKSPPIDVVKIREANPEKDEAGNSSLLWAGRSYITPIGLGISVSSSRSIQLVTFNKRPGPHAQKPVVGAILNGSPMTTKSANCEKKSCFVKWESVSPKREPPSKDNPVGTRPTPEVRDSYSAEWPRNEKSKSREGTRQNYRFRAASQRKPSKWITVRRVTDTAAPTWPSRQTPSARIRTTPASRWKPCSSSATMAKSSPRTSCWSANAGKLKPWEALFYSQVLWVVFSL